MTRTLAALGAIFAIIATTATSCGDDWGDNCYADGMSDCLDGKSYAPYGDTSCQADYDDGWSTSGCSGGYDTGWYYY